MTRIASFNAPVAANDDLSMLDHLLAAHRLAADPFSKHLIELALMNEGQKIAEQQSAHDDLAAGSRGLGTGS